MDGTAPSVPPSPTAAAQSDSSQSSTGQRLHERRAPIPQAAVPTSSDHSTGGRHSSALRAPRLTHRRPDDRRQTARLWTGARCVCSPPISAETGPAGAGSGLTVAEWSPTETPRRLSPATPGGKPAQRTLRAAAAAAAAAAQRGSSQRERRPARALSPPPPPGRCSQSLATLRPLGRCSRLW